MSVGLLAPVWSASVMVLFAPLPIPGLVEGSTAHGLHTWGEGDGKPWDNVIISTRSGDWTVQCYRLSICSTNLTNRTNLTNLKSPNNKSDYETSRLWGPGTGRRDKVSVQ